MSISPQYVTWLLFVKWRDHNYTIWIENLYATQCILKIIYEIIVSTLWIWLYFWMRCWIKSWISSLPFLLYSFFIWFVILTPNIMHLESTSLHIRFNKEIRTLISKSLPLVCICISYKTLIFLCHITMSFSSYPNRVTVLLNSWVIINK